ncbi:class I SAM-dependent methyltransferase [Nitrospira sp. M1]
MDVQKPDTHKSGQQTRCPICHREQLSIFFESKGLPIHSTAIWSSKEEAVRAPKGEIQLGFCTACSMIYNIAFDPSLMRYAQQYENCLHFSPHFQGYARELADQLVEKHRLQGKTIIEIGCGSGEFLSMLCEGGRNRGVGFDPSYDGKRPDSLLLEHLTFIKGYYSEAHTDYQADFICSRHVLEHVESPSDFLSHIRKAIGSRQDCMVFFEVPTVLYLLRDLSIWDIMYEHCSYFCEHSLAQAFSENGFFVQQVTEAFSGQVLCLEATPAHEPRTSPSAEQDNSSTEIQGLVKAFAENYQEKLNGWRNTLREFTLKGQKAVLWGAGARGASFLNMLDATDTIEYAVDISPRKHGQYMGGTGQRIVAPADLERIKPDVIILTNPIYETEIRELVNRMGLESTLLTA